MPVLRARPSVSTRGMLELELPTALTGAFDYPFNHPHKVVLEHLECKWIENDTITILMIPMSVHFETSYWRTLKYLLGGNVFEEVVAWVGCMTTGTFGNEDDTFEVTDEEYDRIRLLLEASTSQRS